MEENLAVIKESCVKVTHWLKYYCTNKTDNFANPTFRMATEKKIHDIQNLHGNRKNKCMTQNKIKEINANENCRKLPAPNKDTLQVNNLNYLENYC